MKSLRSRVAWFDRLSMTSGGWYGLLVTRWSRSVWASWRPFSTGVYSNAVGADADGEEVRAAFGARYDRLVALKTKYDPTNLFRLDANVPPATPMTPA